MEHSCEEQLVDIFEWNAEKLLAHYREENPGKSGSGILKKNLIESGWKYKRSGRGCWYHPEKPDHSALGALRELCATVVNHVLRIDEVRLRLSDLPCSPSLSNRRGYLLAGFV